MNTAPRPPDKNEKPSPKSRIESLDPEKVEMPPIEFGGHLIEILFDVGPVVSTGFGPAPISEAELAAWQFNRGVRLRPWECETIRKLSREYVTMMHMAEKQGMPPPYTPETVMSSEARKAVGEGLRSLAQKQNALRAKK